MSDRKVGTVEGVSVSTFAVQAGGAPQQKVQLAVPEGSEFVVLHPESAEVLGRMLIFAAQQAKTKGDAGRVELGSTRNADRRATIYRYYECAWRFADPAKVQAHDTLPEARDAVRELRGIALNDFGPKLGGVHLNPRLTRSYAVQALGWLALDGWGVGPIDDPAYIRPPDAALFAFAARPMEEVFLTAAHDDRILDGRAGA